MRRLALRSITSFAPFAFLAIATMTNAASAAPKKEAAPSASTITHGNDGTTEPATTVEKSAASKDGDDPKPENAEPVDATLDAVDGIDACSAFEQKNAHDMAIWEKTQPATPYKYPERRTFLDAPWMPLFDGIGYSGALVAATLIPNVHAVLRGSTPEAGISFPWSIPVGPALWCTRKKGSFDVIKYRPVRILLEPGFFAEQPIAFWVRPAARFMWHPTSWFLGVGGGLGSLLEMTGKEPFRASLSPELTVALGRCCNPGYFSLALRHDFFFAGKTSLTSASVGFTYF